MTPYVVVTGDFVRTGGMDIANHALASYLAREGKEVHLVAYRVDPVLAAMPAVAFHRALKPGNAYALGAPCLRALGHLHGRRAARRGGHVIANGGNFPSRDVNWVHYVHAAYAPTAVGALRRTKQWITARLSIKTEREALRRARIVIVNSHRTRRDVIDLVGAPPERVNTV